MLEVRERSSSKRDSYHYFGKLAQALRFECRSVKERGVKDMQSLSCAAYEAVSWRNLASHLPGEGWLNARNASFYWKPYTL